MSRLCSTSMVMNSPTSSAEKTIRVPHSTPLSGTAIAAQDFTPRSARPGASKRTSASVRSTTGAAVM